MNWGGRMSQVLSAWVFCQRYSFLPHSENLQVRLTENFSLTRPGYIDCPLRALENMVQFLPYHLFIVFLPFHTSSLANMTLTWNTLLCFFF